jgi:hypothetical protein
MISRQEAFEGFYGAWRLFFRDKGAAALFDDSISGFWKSFSCAILVLPLYIPMVLFGAGGIESARGPIQIAAIEAIFYVIGWIVWPLLMAYIVPILDRDKEYVLYIVAYNWSNAVQVPLFFAVLALVYVDLVPERGLLLLNFIALVVVFVYHMFILRVTLNVRGPGAFALVFGEFIIGQIVFLIRSGMMA